MGTCPDENNSCFGERSPSHQHVRTNDQGKPPRTLEQGLETTYGLDDIVPRPSGDMPEQEILGIGSNGSKSLSPIALNENTSPPVLTIAQMSLQDRTDERPVLSETRCHPATINTRETTQRPPEKQKTSKDDKGREQTIPKTQCEADYLLAKSTMEEGLEDSPTQNTSISEALCPKTPYGDTMDESLLQATDIEAARNLVGVSSRVFIEQLRGAAFRRKMDVARSRDSLAAKEKEQREAIAASKLETEESKNIDSRVRKMKQLSAQSPPSQETRSVSLGARATGATGVPNIQKRPYTIPRSPLLGRRRDKLSIAMVEKKEARPLPERPRSATTALKARPLPSVSRISDHTGHQGIVKVQKRSSTIPTAPKLGGRRSTRRMSQQSSEKKTVFKARPLPKTTGNIGHAGLAGVTQVQKRQVTTPLSPLLGARRSKLRVDSAKSCMVSGECSRTQLSSSGLVGVNFVDTPSENCPPTETPPRSDSRRGEFIPHSTLRAQKRAEFELTRRSNEILRDKEESRRLRGQIHALERDLFFLREHI